MGIGLGWSAASPGECSGTFACLSANEWGDFLAGVFAPLAFFWLVAAVFIQSQELGAQRQELGLTREELKLTRDEMREQREVMRAQADEAKKQAEFIAVQTAILERQEQTAEKERVISSFEGALADIANTIDYDFNGKMAAWGSHSSGAMARVKFSSEANAREELTREFLSFLTQTVTHQGLGPPYGISAELMSSAEYLLGYIRRALELAPACGPREEVVVKQLQLRDLEQALTTMIDATREAIMRMT
ncbi:hypothetical protein REJC140_03853 [Pseudorhizobium endolithicum]|uniref:Uncharacterized protein n=2 Tax=Pseudorhizobium endolithicum TaxID=1191678 RepID=A0ABN7JRT4_9HYPH|nr:hypothetical protein REJC140_03853 [Pseudorhizobium endolithicum]